MGDDEQVCKGIMNVAAHSESVCLFESVVLFTVELCFINFHHAFKYFH